MSDHPFDYKETVRRYYIVFAVLLIGTVITVSISYLHLPLHLAVTLALIVATVKASFVACYFMHLISERKLIYCILGFTFFFILGLFSLPPCTISVPDGTQHRPFTEEHPKETSAHHVS